MVFFSIFHKMQFTIFLHIHLYWQTWSKVLKQYAKKKCPILRCLRYCINIIRLLGQVYHLSLLISYLCSFINNRLFFKLLLFWTIFQLQNKTWFLKRILWSRKTIYDFFCIHIKDMITNIFVWCPFMTKGP